MNHPETIPLLPGSWKNCLSQDRFPVPKRLGTPGLEEAAILSRKMKFKSFCVIITIIIIIIIRFDGPGVRIPYLVLSQLVGKLSLSPGSGVSWGRKVASSVLAFSSVKWDYSSHLRCLLPELCAPGFRSALWPVIIA